MEIHRKEIIDYLRNQQKAAEIEAKLNGINVWVLLGAIAIVCWQLAADFQGRLWHDPELVLRSLMISVGLCGLSFFLKNSSRKSEDLRYSPGGVYEHNSLPLLLFKGFLFLFPPIGMIFSVGWSVGVVGLGVFGCLHTAFVCMLIVRWVRPATTALEKFPAPEFEITKKAELFCSVFFATFFIFAIFEQFDFIFSIYAGGNYADIRQIGLLIVFYLLIFVLVSRRIRAESIDWTYELETDLILNVVSSEVALRKIENRRLGPRLQDVMNRFFADLDREFSALDALMEDCEQKIRLAKEVPAQYSIERTERVNAAASTVFKKLREISDDCNKFGDYLVKLEKRSNFERNPLYSSVLASLRSRRKAYGDRLLSATDALEHLIS